jgi:outer membrane protein TolC
MKISVLWPGLAGCLLFSSCSTFDSKPLTSDTVEKALERPKLDSVKIAASQLKHPLVKSMTIDGVGGFTPDELAVMSVIVSPALRALRDQKDVAQAQVIQAGILPNPQLSYAIDYPHGQYDPPVVPQKAFGLSWDFTSLITHHATVQAAKDTAKSLDLSVAWQEWQEAEDTRLRALRIASLEKRLPMARKVEASLEDSLKLTRQAMQTGNKTLVDLTAATELWTSAQNTRFDLETTLVSERAALNLSLSLPPNEVVQIKLDNDSSTKLMQAGQDSLNAANSLVGFEDRRLDLVALKLGYESQEQSVRAAVLGQFPKIGLDLNIAQDTTPIKTRGFGVTLDLPIFDRNQGQIAIGKTTRRQLFDEYVARVAEARSEVAQIVKNLAVLRQQMETVEASLPELRTLNQSYENALKAHNADLLAARDAESSLATREIELANLQQELLEQYSALEIATASPHQPSQL